MNIYLDGMNYEIPSKIKKKQKNNLIIWFNKWLNLLKIIGQKMKMKWMKKCGNYKSKVSIKKKKQNNKNVRKLKRKFQN